MSWKLIDRKIFIKEVWVYEDAQGNKYEILITYDNKIYGNIWITINDMYRDFFLNINELNEFLQKRNIPLPPIS
jgi:hypothetical protein